MLEQKKTDSLTPRGPTKDGASGDIQKCQNKARFFEESLAEREQEALQWKHKFEQDKDEHSKSQEALIHGFTAEISNLKSQIFHFKTQLYGVKSPTKSPGNALKSPDVKSGNLFSPGSKLHSSTPDSKLHSSTPKSFSHKHNLSHNVQEEMVSLQSEMDKNVSSIAELENALHVSRLAVEDLEKRLANADEKNRISESKIEELQVRIVSIDETDESNKQNSELVEAKQKIKEFESQIKMNVEQLAKQRDVELEIDNLNEQIDLKNKTIYNLENKQKHLEIQVSELQQLLKQKEDNIENCEKKEEELEILNAELKEMVNKTTIDLQSKQIELQLLSPQSAAKLKHSENQEICCEMSEKEKLRHELECKDKEINKLKEKVKKLKAGFKAEEILLKEANSKQSDLEFRIDEKEVENQDLRNKKKEFHHKLEDLQFGINEKGKELTQAGEELALAKTEVLKLKRINTEKEAIINLKDSLITEQKGKIDELKKQNVQEHSCDCVNTDHLKKTLEENVNKINMLEAEIDKYKERSKSTDEKISKMEGLSEEILKLQNLLKGKEDKINEMNGETAMLKEKADNLNSCIVEQQRLEKQVEELKSTLIEKEEELEMLSDNLSAMLDEKEIEDKHSDEKRKLTERIHDLEVQLKCRQNEFLECNGIAAVQDKDDNFGVIDAQKSIIDSQNAKIKDLDSKINSLSEQVKEKENLEMSFIDLESAVVDKEVELCDKDRQMEHKTVEVASLSARIASLEIELKNKSEKISELESKYETKTTVDEANNLESANQKLCEASAKSEELKNLLMICEQKCDNLEKDVGRLHALVDEKISYIETCEKELKISEGKIKCVLEKNNDLEKIIDSKSKELKDIKENYNNLKQKIDSNNVEESKLADALCEIAELKSAVHTHKTLHHNLKGELEEALLELENKRSETNTLRKENETTNKELEDQLNKKVAELEESKLKISNLEVELEKKNIDVVESQTLHRELTEANNTTEELRNQIVTLRSDLDRSQNRTRVLEQGIQDIHSDCDEKIAAVSEMKTEVHRLLEEKKKSMAKLGEENDSLKTELVKNKSSHEQTVTDLLEEIENLKQENEQLTDTENTLKSQKETDIAKMSQNEKEIKKLSLTIDELKSEIKDLRNGLLDVESEKTDLTNELHELKNERNLWQKERTQLLEVKGEKTELEEKCSTLNMELIDLKDLLKNEENHSHTLSEEVRKLEKLHHSEIAIDNKPETEKNASLKISELQALYDSEKSKNEEYHKMLNDMKEQNCLSPQTGVRKLRKDKIDAENALIEARFTIKSLEKKLKDAELNSEHKQSVLSINHHSSGTSESVLQQKLNRATSKLHEVENNNKSLIKEVTQLQGTVERLEKTLDEERNKHEVMIEEEACQRTVASVMQADPRQSISSPSTKVELNKSREREHALHEQLNKAKVLVQEWSLKFTNIENDLQQKSQELQDAKDKVAALERNKLEGSKHTDEELQKYQERISDLERDIIQKEEQLDSKTIVIDDLKQQLETGFNSMKNFKQDIKSKDETIAVLKETLGEQENMLQLQEDYINKKESEIEGNKTDYQSLLDKYQTLLLSKDTNQHEHLEEARNAARTEAERDLLRKQLVEVELKLQRAVDDRERTNQTLKEVEHKHERVVDDKERTNQILKEVEHKLEKTVDDKERTNQILKEVELKLKKATEEKEKTDKVLTENNKELKEMEKMLTEVRRECEDLRSQGSDKHAETRIENLKHDLEKQIHDLQHKNKELHAELKDVKAKFSMAKETLKVAVEERHGHEKTLKDNEEGHRCRKEFDDLDLINSAVFEENDEEFREERDKLVSGLEAILKKKDAEIKQYKEQIKQLKDKEEQLTKSWKNEREKIGSGLQQLEKNICKVKTEPVDDDSSGDNRTYRSPVVRKGSYREAMTPLSPENNVDTRAKPPRPDPPQVQDNTEESSQSVFKSPLRRVRSHTETPGSASISGQRGSSRRGRKRSPAPRDEDLPPIPPKRVSTDTSMVSESDDMSSHLQVDATPTVAAKTLRRTRKKNGSQIDLSVADENATSTRPQRSSKRSARSRILESFRESPIAKGSKRILDNIAEAFSPKSSPTKSPKKEQDSNNDCDSKSRAESKENLTTPSNLEVKEKKPAGRGRGRHKLYKEDTYISEPMEFKADFVKSPDDVHKTVTRSLRSRRH